CQAWDNRQLQFLMPVIDEGGLGVQVGNGRRHVGRRRLEDSGDAHEWQGNIEWRQRINPREGGGYSLEPTQQPARMGQALEDHAHAWLCEQCQVANELDRVPQTLFGKDKQSAAFKRRTVPAGLLKGVPGKTLGLPAPFILLPSFRPITQ